jgi:hypothetical protein
MDRRALYTKIYTRFYIHPECSSLNIYWIEECLEHKLKRRMELTSHVQLTVSIPPFYGVSDNSKTYTLPAMCLSLGCPTYVPLFARELQMVTPELLHYAYVSELV